jgi:hypothetical protein
VNNSTANSVQSSFGALISIKKPSLGRSTPPLQETRPLLPEGGETPALTQANGTGWRTATLESAEDF